MTFSYFLFIIPINTITHLIIIGKYIRIFQTKTILISFFLNFLLFYKCKGLFFYNFIYRIPIHFFLFSSLSKTIKAFRYLKQ